MQHGRSQAVIFMYSTERLNILAASDIHGKVKVYEWIARCAAEGDIDLIILAGDLTAHRDRDSEDEIKRILLPAGIPVLFIMGNMDRYEWRNEPLFVNINCRRYIFNGVPFTGYQYTNPFMGGIFEKDEEGQKRDFDSLSALVDEDTVLVTHGPCRGILDKTWMGFHVGSRSLLGLCMDRKPKYHIFGHIHESSGIAGNYFNVSYPRSKSVLKLEYYSGDYEIIRAG